MKIFATTILLLIGLTMSGFIAMAVDNLRAVDLNGSNEYFTQTETAAFSPDQGTISLWVIPEVLGNSSSMLSSDEFGGSAAGFNLDARADGSVRFAFSGESDLIQTDTGKLQNARSNHVLVTWDISGKEIFIDSVSSVTGTLDETLAEGVTLHIGRHAGGSYDYFNGILDEIVFFDVVLNQDEIDDMFDQTGDYCDLIDTSNANLVAFWRFEGDDGTDETGNYSLTEVNAPGYTSTVPFASYSCASAATKRKTGVISFPDF